MKLQHILFLFCLCRSTGFLSAQNCIPITTDPIQACVQKTELYTAKLKALKKEPDGTLNKLFYQYFTGTDYNEYKSLFSPNDWYGLTTEDFVTWRTFVDHADLKVLGSVELNALGLDLGIVKYTYIMDDVLVYETFTARKAGKIWKPVSEKEEEKLITTTGLIKNVNLEYLSSMMASKRESASNISESLGPVLESRHMIEAKDSLKTFTVEDFKKYYNTDTEFLTDKKFREDRTNDAKFMGFLKEMGLSQDQMDVVMKYIMIQDYIHAAQKADDYSTITYTFSPFVEKIREVYGLDRIKKWDQQNNKWD